MEIAVFGSINEKFAEQKYSHYTHQVKSLMNLKALVAQWMPLFTTIHNEICRLEQLRDSLLPKLMSGELDVSDIDF